MMYLKFLHHIQYVLLCSHIFGDKFRKQMNNDDVQSLFARHLDDILVVYRYYATSDLRAWRKKFAPKGTRNLKKVVKFLIRRNKYGHKPTMSLEEFTELMIDSALLSTNAEDRSNISNTLTKFEGRVCFAQSQKDSDEETKTLEELVFPEFCEAIARVADAKWESPELSFVQKVKLAIDSILRTKASNIAHETKEERQFDAQKRRNAHRRRMHSKKMETIRTMHSATATPPPGYEPLAPLAEKAQR